MLYNACIVLRERTEKHIDRGELLLIGIHVRAQKVIREIDLGDDAC